MTELTPHQAKPVTFDDIMHFFAQWRKQHNIKA